MTRATDEWIAKHDDEKIPARVQLRVWARCNGTCYLTKIKIRPGMAYQIDHIIALCNGGSHRESNLAIVLSEAHKRKTADDVRLRAKIDRIRKKHAGIETRKGPAMPGTRASGIKRKINGQVEWRR